MRHQAEITGDCRISLENISNRPFSFSVLPSKADRLYILDAGSQEERVVALSLYYCIEYVDPMHPGVQIPGPANQQSSHLAWHWKRLRSLFSGEGAWKGPVRRCSSRGVQCAFRSVPLPVDKPEELCGEDHQQEESRSRHLDS